MDPDVLVGLLYGLSAIIMMVISKTFIVYTFNLFTFKYGEKIQGFLGSERNRSYIDKFRPFMRYLSTAKLQIEHSTGTYGHTYFFCPSIIVIVIRL